MPLLLVMHVCDSHCSAGEESDIDVCALPWRTMPAASSLRAGTPLNFGSVSSAAGLRCLSEVEKALFGEEAACAAFSADASPIRSPIGYVMLKLK